MKRLPLTFALVIVAAASSRLGAQAQPMTIPLAGTPAKFTAGAPDAVIPVSQKAAARDTLQITCAAAFDCTRVRMSGDAATKVVLLPGATSTVARFVVPGGPGEVDYKGRITHGATPADNELTFKATSDGRSSAPSGGTPTLAQQVAGWLASPCVVEGRLPDAHIVMTPFGRVLNRPPRRFDDEDRVTVSVLVDERVAHLVAVREASDLASPVVTNIYGADAAPFSNQSTGGKATDRQPPRCVYTGPEPVGPFASPKGVAQVTVYDGTTVKDLGSTQFVVAPLYTGTFMLGGISTALAAPSYVTAFNGTDTVIVERDAGRRMLYTATYTHFWKKRDLMASAWASGEPWLAFSPMVGVVLNDITSNALVGVNVELRPGLGVSAGAHFGRVNVLEEGPGVQVGEPFENRGDVPVDKEWKSATFFGVNLDVRAAGGLLKSVLGGGAQ